MVVTGVDRHPVREKKSGAECGSLSVALHVQSSKGMQ